MKYWLYTWEYPDGDIDEWAIYKVEDIWPDEDEGVDMARVKEVVIDKWNALAVGDIDTPFDDAMTEDPKNVIKFLFDQVFY